MRRRRPGSAPRCSRWRELNEARRPAVPLTAPVPGEQQRRKRNLLIIGGLLILLVTTMTTVVYEVGIWSPKIPVASNLLVFALFNLTLIVFLLLLVLLFRNFVKLFFERRQKVLGSQFKTRLVMAFLSLALIPALLISIIASNLLNTSIEGWFKPQVEAPLCSVTTYGSGMALTLSGKANRLLIGPPRRPAPKPSLAMVGHWRVSFRRRSTSQ